MSFEAQFRGCCSECEEWFEPGTEIASDGELRHGRSIYRHFPKCPDVPDPLPAAKPGEKPCPVCGTLHPGEC